MVVMIVSARLDQAFSLCLGERTQVRVRTPGELVGRADIDPRCAD